MNRAYSSKLQAYRNGVLLRPTTNTKLEKGMSDGDFLSTQTKGLFNFEQSMFYIICLITFLTKITKQYTADRMWRK